MNHEILLDRPTVIAEYPNLDGKPSGFIWWGPASLRAQPSGCINVEQTKQLLGSNQALQRIQVRALMAHVKSQISSIEFADKTCGREFARATVENIRTSLASTGQTIKGGLTETFHYDWGRDTKGHHVAQVFTQLSDGSEHAHRVYDSARRAKTWAKQQVNNLVCHIRVIPNGNGNKAGTND